MSLSKSSLLDLKAELLKKTEEIKNKKVQRTSIANEKRKLHKKTSLFSRKNVGVSDRAEKDFEARVEEEDAITKSRKQLEAKSRIYAQMTSASGVSEHDGSKGFLVDFEQKSIRNISDQREQERKDKEEREKEEDEAYLDEEIDEPLDPNERWVDYVDSFGRSRRCLRKDLPDLEQMDRKLTERRKSSSDSEEDNIPKMTAGAKYREQVRLKWEEEERKNMGDPDGPMHYANIQDNEIRTHGVGYYQFNRDHGSREEQIEALKQLREQTKETREKKVALKQKRKAILKARLAKVKQRKLVREGLSAADLEKEESSDSEEEHMIGPQFGEAFKGEGRESPELLTRDESLRKDAPARDWDMGKQEDGFDEEKWLDNRREERDDEFAPPSSYQEPTFASSRRYSKQRESPETTTSSRRYPKQRESPETTTSSRRYAKEKEFPDAMTSSDFTAPPADVTSPEFAPPPSYFANKNKSKFRMKVGNLVLTKPPKTPMKPMAFLEEQVENKTDGDSTVDTDKVSLEQSVTAGLSAIRSQVDNRAKSTVQQRADDTVSRDANNSRIVGDYPPPSQDSIFPPQSNDYTRFPVDMSSFPPPPPLPPGNSAPHMMSLGSDMYQSHYADMSSFPPPPPLPPSGGNVPYPMDSNAYQAQTPFYPPVYPDYGHVPNDGIPTNQTQYANEQQPADLHNTAVPPAAASEPASTSAGKSKYSSAPVKYDRFNAAPVKTRYERVNLYDVPESLPAPPTMESMPVYPSQEEIFGSQNKSKTKEKSEKNLQQMWNRQFQNDTAKPAEKFKTTDSDVKSSLIGRLKSENIPFVSPYVQTSKQQDDGSEANEDKIEFDPAKPPPNLLPQSEGKGET